MIIHYIKVAFRNLVKYKVQTLISILSMAVGVMVFTIVWSLLSQFEPSTLTENPNSDRICILNVRNLSIQESQNIANNGLMSAEKVFVTWDHNIDVAYFPVYEGDEIVRQTREWVSLVSEGFMEFYGCKSIFTGETISTPKHNEVVVTDRFAKEHFGSTDVRGREMVASNFIYKENTQTNQYIVVRNEEDVTFRISDVIHKPSWTEQFIDGTDVFMLNESPYMNGSYLIAELKEGYTCEDAANEFPKVRENGPEVYAESLESFVSRTNTMLYRIKVASYILGLLILMASFLGFIRMQIQLFWIRQREVALRTVVGGQLHSLVSLFMTEISIVMLFVAGLAILFDSIIRNIIEETIYQKISEEMFWNMDDFGIKSVIITIFMAIVCSIVVGIVIKRMKKGQTGLAMSMKPSTNKRMRTISLCIQMVISTLFICFTLMIVETMDSSREKAGIPESDDMIQKNGLLVTDLDDSYVSARKCVENSTNVEKILPYSENFWFRPNDEAGNQLTGPYFQIRGTECLYEYGNELVDFFGVKIEEVTHTARHEETVYVNQVMYNSLRQEQPEGILEVNIFDRIWQVAGIMNTMPYKGDGDGRRCYAILNGQVPVNAGLLVIAKEGQKEALIQELKKESPNAMMYGATKIAKGIIDSGVSAYLHLLFKGSIILTLISIFNTISSLYSAISLDSRRRRKEVSLRKVNGATYVDIAKIFAKDYIIMLSICFAITLPVAIICGMSFMDSGITDNVIVGTLLVFFQTVLLISIITFLTIWWKIKEIMHIMPVEGLTE